MKYDCLILGYYDFSFDRYLEMTRSMGADTGAFRDVNLAFVEVDQKPYRALDIFSEFYNQNNPDKDPVNYHNMDFLWPTVSCLGTFLDRHDFTFDYVNLVHLEMDKLREKLLTND